MLAEAGTGKRAAWNPPASRTLHLRRMISLSSENRSYNHRPIGYRNNRQFATQTQPSPKVLIRARPTQTRYWP
jgi:hypothetical protein